MSSARVTPLDAAVALPEVPNDLDEEYTDTSEDESKYQQSI